MHFMHALDKMEDDDIGDISKIKNKKDDAHCFRLHVHFIRT